jgi:sulfur transfer complex TusBCD TusB component (DsrH family)
MPQRSQTGRRVFVTNVGSHNYEKAKRFGDLIPITQGRVNVASTDRMMQDIAATLTPMQEKDHILLSGNPVIVALVVAEVMHRYGSVNLIYWDAMYQDYFPRTWPPEKQG